MGHGQSSLDGLGKVYNHFILTRLMDSFSAPGKRTHEEIIMYFTINNPEPCLILSMEESGEFIRAASKVIRHGLTNEYKAQLIEEAGDVVACLYLLE